MTKNTPPEFIRPRLRIFLSVDIVGSTAFKQSHSSSKFKQGETQQTWLGTFSTFYHAFEGLFAKEWGKAVKKNGHEMGQSPFLWKILGDELIYCKEISQLHQIFVCIHVWKKIIEEYRKKLHKKEKLLDLKSTLWVAGFPYLNAEMAFVSPVDELNNEYEGEGNAFLKNLMHLEKYYEKAVNSEKIIIDFIGPAMDTGFRLDKFANNHKMILSIDLAYMLSFEKNWYEKIGKNKYGFKKIEVGYDGRETLKGVINGKPYPLIWINMLPPDDTTNLHLEDQLRHQEYKLCGQPKLHTAHDIQDLSKTFLTLNDQYPILPYINNDQKYKDYENPESFYKTPREHEEKINYIKKEYHKQIEKDAQAQTSLKEKGDKNENPPKQTPESLAKTLTGNILNKNT